MKSGTNSILEVCFALPGLHSGSMNILKGVTNSHWLSNKWLTGLRVGNDDRNQHLALKSILRAYVCTPSAIIDSNWMKLSPRSDRGAIIVPHNDHWHWGLTILTALLDCQKRLFFLVWWLSECCSFCHRSKIYYSKNNSVSCTRNTSVVNCLIRAHVGMRYHCWPKRHCRMMGLFSLFSTLYTYRSVLELPFILSIVGMPYVISISSAADELLTDLPTEFEREISQRRSIVINNKPAVKASLKNCDVRWGLDILLPKEGSFFARDM